jgi:transcriptional regulator with PAS, ATPase and Fis domain
VLETRRVARVGATRETPVDVHVLCATHRDLRAEIAAGRFREDLFYRLSGFTLRIPALRERRQDIALLARHFMQEARRRIGTCASRIDAGAERALVEHCWPGNVRELRNAIEHALVVANRSDTIRVEHLPESVRERHGEADLAATLHAQLASLERRTIEAMLANEGGNQTRTARRLGITRRALIYRLRKLNILT